MIDKPFIHLLKSPYHHYLFDVNTNSIVRISKDLYHYLDCLNHDENCQFSEDIRCEYNTLKENGYLKTKRPNSIQSPFLNDLNYFLNYHMNMLTLQVTQECNFRCSYCSYTIGDGITQRGHHSIRMSWETAKKAIDFWSKRVRHTNEINLGFYGGEPLLEWPLIKKCVLYAKTKLEGKHITFNMTTNATLLTEEMARFFVDNHVRLTISLDGPKEIHDRNRRFAINGEGTFDAVMSKIEEMREKVKGFQDIININSVIDPCNDAKCIVDFFNHGIAEDVRPSNLLPPPGTTI